MAMTPRKELVSAVRAIDDEGFFRPEDVGPVRSAMAKLVEDGEVPEHPAELFGPWEALPRPAQDGLRRLAESEITRVMDFHPRGFLWPRLVGGMYAASRFLGTRKNLSVITASIRTCASRGWSLPRNLRERLNVRARRKAWARGKRVSVADLLAALGRRPSWLLGDYLTAVKVDHRCRGFYADRRRNVAFGYLIGIDLIPSPEGVWCVEANLNTAFNNDRRAVMSPEPAVDVLVQAATETNARHVKWLDMDWAESPPWLIGDIFKAAGKAGLQAEIREDYRILKRAGREPGLPVPKKRLMSPTKVPPDTLLLRRNSYDVGSDFLVSNKDPFIRGVGAALRDSEG